MEKEAKRCAILRLARVGQLFWFTWGWCCEPFPEKTALSSLLIFLWLSPKWSWHYHVPTNLPDVELFITTISEWVWGWNPFLWDLVDSYCRIEGITEELEGGQLLEREEWVWKMWPAHPASFGVFLSFNPPGINLYVETPLDFVCFEDQLSLGPPHTHDQLLGCPTKPPRRPSK